MTEQVPGDLTEPVGLATAAPGQVDQAIVRQGRDGHLAGAREVEIGSPATLAQGAIFTTVTHQSTM
ncbi:hypothetical protein ACJ4V0_07145 [Phreatobacter sp. HK31-P]